jgi:hypothetical protein
VSAEQCIGRTPPLAPFREEQKPLIFPTSASPLVHFLYAANGSRTNDLVPSLRARTSKYKVHSPSQHVDSLGQLSEKDIDDRKCQMPITATLTPKNQKELNEKIIGNPKDPLIPDYVQSHVSTRLWNVERHFLTRASLGYGAA